MPQQTATVVMYRTQFCPFCVDAARLLDDLEIAYETISLDDQPDRARITSEILSGHYTVPLIVIDGEPVGGCQELSALHAAGELKPRVFGGAA